ncbi:MAG TPA: hypothetical protein VHY56_05085, partial [Candidatus Binataceae bacterium]|nr:hypothetical protein [Candidatus Binataceae bacterium]
RCLRAALRVAYTLALTSLPLFVMLFLVEPLYAGNPPDLLPDTAIAPADNGPTPATPSPRRITAPRATAPAQRPNDGGGGITASPAPIVHHHPSPRASSTPIPNLVYEVEPADSRLLLRADTTAYLQPSKMSPVVEQLQAGKFLHVTGATHYFVQAKLKNGSLAYVPSDDVYLTVPADKIFRLTSDTAVLDRPDKWAKQVAIVHQGHDVHVVGVALTYMKIQMKSGLEGYIPSRALE